MPSWFWHLVSLTAFGKEQYRTLGSTEVLGVCNQKGLWNRPPHSLGGASHTQCMQLPSSFSSNPELWPQSRHSQTVGLKVFLYLWNGFEAVLSGKPWYERPDGWSLAQHFPRSLTRNWTITTRSALPRGSSEMPEWNICTSPMWPQPWGSSVWAPKDLSSRSGWQKSAESRKWHLVTLEFRAHKETLSEETLYPAVPPRELHGLLLH